MILIILLTGAGIGVTPFASVLKRLHYRLENEKGTKKVEKVHFFWTCREQGAFQWFADILSQLESNENAKVCPIISFYDILAFGINTIIIGFLRNQHFPYGSTCRA